MRISKLCSVMAPKAKILQFCTSTNTRGEVAESTARKRLEHYRNLNALNDAELNPADWDQARPFENIPGPTPLPIIGNTWRFILPRIGNFYGLDHLEVFKKLCEDYGEIAILKDLIGLAQLVVLFNPKDIEKLHRNEGIWPIRKGLISFTHYREQRKDILKSGGLVTLQGEEWFKFRTIVNPILMQPKNMVQYTDNVNLVSQELVDNIKFFSEQNEEGQMPDDFINELYKWSLESIGLITLDTRLGCLKRHLEKDSEPQKLIDSVIRMFQLMYALDIQPSFWKIISTPSWKEYVKVLDFLLHTNLKYINRSLESLQNGEAPANDSTITSVLHKMLKIDKSVAFAMGVDMMIAGVDTTGRVLGAALYYLSKNPEKQEILRNEAFSLLKTKDSPVTKETLAKTTYTRAVIRETMRLSPIAIGNMRTLSRKLVLGGYQVPAGTNVISSNLLLCHRNEHFPRAKEFLPERWLSSTVDELSHKKSNPFVYAPFGNGPRSCIGKRIANLELETTILKIARNFELRWPHEEMVFKTTTLHGIAGPLKLHVKELRN